jgi:hypothetical protein
MKTRRYAVPRIGLASPHSTTIWTTLYELIEAIAAEVGPDEEAFVTATAIHLLGSHRARLIDTRVRAQAYCERTNYVSSASA